MIELTVTIERTFRVDADRIRQVFAAELAADVRRGMSSGVSEQETFYELCGVDRECDHHDGELIVRVDESVDIEWPEGFGRE